MNGVDPIPVLPTRGRPRPVVFIALFLPAVADVMTIDEMPYRLLMEQVDADYGTHLASVTRRAFTPGERISPAAATAFTNDLAQVLNLAGAPTTVTEALRQPLPQGEWGQAKAGLSPEFHTWHHEVIRHGAEIEAASAKIRRVVHAGEGGIAEVVRANRELSPYLSESALASLGRGRDGARQAQSAGLCEFLLSQVARVDAHPAPTFDGAPGQRFADMVRVRRSGRIVPGAGFVTCLKLRYGTGSTTMEGMLEDLPTGEDGRRPTDYKTVQSWNSGATLPDREAATRLVGALVLKKGIDDPGLLQQEWRHFDLQLWAALRLGRTLQLARGLCAADAAPGLPRFIDLLEAASPDEWCRKRYAFWLSHWMQYPAQSHD